jgi:hypothetical protein
VLIVTDAAINIAPALKTGGYLPERVDLAIYWAAKPKSPLRPSKR